MVIIAFNNKAKGEEDSHLKCFNPQKNDNLGEEKNLQSKAWKSKTRNQNSTTEGWFQKERRAKFLL